MFCGEGPDVVAVEVNGFTVINLMGDDFIGGSEVAEAEELCGELVHAWRSPEMERVCPVVELHGLDESGKSEEVVAVEVRDEDVGYLHVGEAGALELPLGAFSAVEKEDFTASVDGGGGDVALDGRPAAAGAEEEDSQLRHKDAGHRTGG